MPLVDAGDTFDTKSPTSFDVGFLGYQLGRMREAGLPVYVIQGQHDQSDPPWTHTATLGYARHVHNCLFEPVPGLRLFGMDAMKRTAAEQSVAGIPPECNAVLMHQLCKEVFDKDGVWDFSVATLPPQVRTALLADFHQTIDVEVPREGYEPCHLIYTGSGHVCKIDEDWSKVITVIRHLGDGRVQADRVPMQARPMLRLSLASETDLDAAVELLRTTDFASRCPEDVPDQLRYALVYVTFPFGLPEVGARLRAALGDRGHIWEAMYGSVAEMESRVEEPPEQGVVLEECLARFMVPGSNPFELTRALLSTTAPSLVFEEWRRRLGVVEAVATK